MRIYGDSKWMTNLTRTICISKKKLNVFQLTGNNKEKKYIVLN